MNTNINIIMRDTALDFIMGPITTNLNLISKLLNQIVQWVIDTTQTINETVQNIQLFFEKFTIAFNSLFSVPFVNGYTQIGLSFLQIIVGTFLTVFAVKVVQRFF